MNKKIENFWFYHKWKVIFGAFIAVVLAVSVGQLVSRPDYDHRLLYYVSSVKAIGVSGGLERKMQVYGSDRNGDGNVLVQVVDRSFDPSGNTPRFPFELTDSRFSIVITDDATFAQLDGQGVFGSFPTLGSGRKTSVFLRDQNSKAVNVSKTALGSVFDQYWPDHPNLWVSLRKGASAADQQLVFDMMREFNSTNN